MLGVKISGGDWLLLKKSNKRGPCAWKYSVSDCINDNSLVVMVYYCFCQMSALEDPGYRIQWVSSTVRSHCNIYLFIYSFVIFVFSSAAPRAYGGSQARGLIGAVASHLCQSYSNSGSEPHLQPTPQLTATPDP